MSPDWLIHFQIQTPQNEKTKKKKGGGGEISKRLLKKYSNWKSDVNTRKYCKP